MQHQTESKEQADSSAWNRVGKLFNSWATKASNISHKGQTRRRCVECFGNQPQKRKK